MRKLLKKIPKSGTYIVPCVIIACVLLYVIILRVNAESMGTVVGQLTGSQKGKFDGSLEALANYREACAEGKEEGLSAEDTVVEVANKMKEVKRLEVLVASVKLNDISTIGDDYAALYLLKGDAVFTVDLSKAEITEETDGLHIMLPRLDVDPIIDESKVEKVDEYQKWSFSGKTEDGFNAYLNSTRKLIEESKETLANDASLKMIAEEAAIKQVTQLANSVAVEKRDIIVSFKEEQ